MLIQNEDSIPHLLQSVNTAINESPYPIDTESVRNEPLRQNKLEAVTKLVSKWEGSSKGTRDWTKANQLIKELEDLLAAI